MGLIRKGIRQAITDGPRELIQEVPKYIQGEIYRSHPSFVRNIYTPYHRLSGYSAIPDPYKIVYLSPTEINRYTYEFGKWESVGLIQSGDWDRRASPITEMPKYRAVKKHFRDGLSWKETGIFDYLLKRIRDSENDSVDNCTNRAELVDRYERIDELYENIRREGYREDRHSSTDYIAAHIARDGKFLFAGSGCHRLAIARLLDLDEIPVWIRVRHAEWQAKRDELSDTKIVQETNEHLQKYSNHPDVTELI
jgi:hypothetical protein